MSVVLEKTISLRNRAAVWLAWGDKYVASAEASRASFAAQGYSYPTCLITDSNTANSPHASGFDRVITAEFRQHEGGHLRKCELWDWLPSDCDSFVFFDDDTRILSDISLGFEKAERHGLALAPALHYCMDHFWGFDAVMRAEQVPMRGQIQYNSGVIFFTRRPDVATVFQRWKELAHRHGGTHDQPFLSLALEQLDVLPYVLSPNYNYRGLGMPISGDVRVWHSRRHVPPRLNALPHEWPLRYVMHGKVKIHPPDPKKPKQILHWLYRRMTGKI